MGVNRDKPDFWKADIALSVDMYNDWFMNFAPDAYRATRIITTENVEKTLKATDNLNDVRTEVIKQNPHVLPTLRMSTCPPYRVGGCFQQSSKAHGIRRIAAAYACERIGSTT
jgi:hypothetical protein